MEQIPDTKTAHKKNSFFAALSSLVVLAVVATLLGIAVTKSRSVPPREFAIDFTTEESSTDILDLEITRPTGLPSEIQKKTDAWIDGLKNDVQDQANTTEDGRGVVGGSEIAYALEIKKPEFYITGNVASMVIEAYFFTGGAHGNSAFFTTTFDKELGKELTLSDVVGHETSYEKIASVVEPIALEQLLLKIQENSLPIQRDELENALRVTFAEGLAPKAENFSLWYVDGKKIIFVFPPYQIAPYVFGTVRVPVPVESL